VDGRLIREARSVAITRRLVADGARRAGRPDKSAVGAAAGEIGASDAARG
jgi:hypothetical protein